MNKEIFGEKDFEHLLELSRLEIPQSEKAGLLENLREILAYFEELKSLNLEDKEDAVEKGLRNVAREDASGFPAGNQKGVDAFPETENNFLKIPPIFE